MNELSGAVAAILEKLDEVGRGRAILVGVSGIDASGKGYLCDKLDAELFTRSLRTALIHADEWLNLPSVRFGGDEPGGHFYENAIRLDAMFERLILPLKRDREIRLTAELLTETASDFEPYTYEFRGADVVLVEGIFLFKRRFVHHFDLRIWIECSFETALERAVRRSQEGLSAEATFRTYETVFFPAQRHHFAFDDPISAADLVFDNN